MTVVFLFHSHLAWKFENPSPLSFCFIPFQNTAKMWPGSGAAPLHKHQIKFRERRNLSACPPALMLCNDSANGRPTAVNVIAQPPAAAQWNANAPRKTYKSPAKLKSRASQSGRPHRDSFPSFDPLPNWDSFYWSIIVNDWVAHSIWNAATNANFQAVFCSCITAHIWIHMP